MSDEQLPITEQWLAASGFKWHELERQGAKHWLLWLGRAIEDGSRLVDANDLGIEVAPVATTKGMAQTFGDDAWFCWIRSDFAHRYSRFLHIRHIRTRHDLLWLIEALTGQEWSADNAFYGMLHTPARAEQLRQEEQRFDRRILESSYSQRDVEKDPYQGGALPEHLAAHEKRRCGTCGHMHEGSCPRSAR